MKKLTAILGILVLSTSLLLTTHANTSSASLPDGHHVLFFDESILERHRDIFLDTFLTDEAHMDWLTEEYNRLFEHDWEAYDVLRAVILQNIELVSEFSVERLTELSLLELRDAVMSVLYAVDVDMFELDDFVGGLRWSVYNLNLELSMEELVERFIYVMGSDNLAHLLPQ